MPQTRPIGNLTILFCLLILFSAGSLLAEPWATFEEPQLTDYLPPGVSYDPSVPKPAEILGFEPGSWHVRPDQLLRYLEELARVSPRVRLEVTGYTYERRPLVLLTISSPRNLSRIEEIRTEHLKLSNPKVPKPDTAKMPAVVYLGYSVHGNEASGSNAAPVVAYHLAAAQGKEIESLLGETVILLDPSFNPDGLGRFAHWANTHRAKVPVGDRDHREHRETWPGGRTNHYWFDLNRDWILAQHPETRARLASFQRWRPNVLTDHHEMGGDSTYFFQPGIESRQNPLTPARNLELTREIATFHAATLDHQGRLYYTEESFDDFYYGKGSTYPDIQGAIGILFEQASSRGLLADTVNGALPFPMGVHNQFLTSLSTMQAARTKRQELLDYQAEFYREAWTEAGSGSLSGYLFGETRDPARAFHLAELLGHHDIEVLPLTQEVRRNETVFRPGSAYVVPLAQAQSRLVRALFERRVQFPDSTFYDVSTWSLPLAFGLPFVELSKDGLKGLATGSAPEGTPTWPAAAAPARGEDIYAYAFAWDGYYAPRALYSLQAAGVRTRVAKRPFRLPTTGKPVEMTYGAIVVPLGGQEVDRQTIEALIAQIGSRDGIQVHAATSGLTPAGIDLGSPSLEPLEMPRPALLVGNGISGYDAGEVWHLLDHRFQIRLPLLDLPRLGSIDLADYSHLILVDGRYEKHLNEKEIAELERWLRQGGVLIAMQEAIPFVDETFLGQGEENQDRAGAHGNQQPVDSAREETQRTGIRLPYAERETNRAKQLISGAIFEVELDTTHPLAYGYRQAKLPVFRDSKQILEPVENPYATVARYGEASLLSGYISEKNYQRLAESPAITVHRLGGGTVIRMVDNPNFRAFWYGTNKLFLNGLFFGDIIFPPER